MRACRELHHGLLGSLVVVVLGSTPGTAQIPVVYDPDERHELLFAQFPGEIRACRETGEPMSVARLGWFHDAALLYRIQFPERWPDAPAFDAFVRDVHAFRAEQGHPTDAFASAEWNRSLDLEDYGAFDDEQLLMRTLLEVYPEDDPNRLRWLLALASCDRGTGRWEEALERLDALEELIDASPPAVAGSPEATEVRFLVDAERISIHVDLGLYEEAVRTAGRARERAERLGHPGPWSTVVQLEINIALAVDDPGRAERIFAEARAHPLYRAAAEGERMGMRLRLALSQAERERLDPTAPRHALDTLVGVRMGELSSVDRILAEQWTAELLMDAGKTADARAALLRARRELDRRRAPRPGEPPLRAEVDQIVNEARLALMSGARGEELREHESEARRAFDSLLERWAGTVAPPSGLAILHTRDRMRVTESIVELVLAASEGAGGGPDGPELALAEVVRAQRLGSLARELDAPTHERDGTAPSLDAIRADLLPPGGGLLVLLPGAVKSFAFTVDARRVRAFELPPIYRLDPLRRALVRAIDDALAARSATGPAADVLESVADEMASELLPGELAEVLRGWEELSVVGLDSLGYVPFEYLPLSATERLGDRLAVGYLPSLPVGIALARRPHAPVRARITLFSAPGALFVMNHRGPGPAPLSFTERERERLLGRAGAETVVVEHATLGPLLAGDFSGDLALQILAHGYTTARADRPQGLLLFRNAGGADPAGANVLTPKLAESLRPPPIVLLTACGAWRGTRRRGDDGRAHLGGSLLLAGARTVVLAHTAVDYQASLELNGDFLESLTGGGASGAGAGVTSPTRALFAARARARQRGDDDLHPVHAYLFHAVGLGSEVPLVDATFVRPDEREVDGLFSVGWIRTLAGLAALAALGLVLWPRIGRRGGSGADGSPSDE